MNCCLSFAQKHFSVAVLLTLMPVLLASSHSLSGRLFADWFHWLASLPVVLAISVCCFTLSACVLYPIYLPSVHFCSCCALLLRHVSLQSQYSLSPFRKDRVVSNWILLFLCFFLLILKKKGSTTSYFFSPIFFFFCLEISQCSIPIV